MYVKCVSKDLWTSYLSNRRGGRCRSQHLFVIWVNTSFKTGSQTPGNIVHVFLCIKANINRGLSVHATVVFGWGGGGGRLKLRRQADTCAWCGRHRRLWLMKGLALKSVKNLQLTLGSTNAGQTFDILCVFWHTTSTQTLEKYLCGFFHWEHRTGADMKSHLGN